MLPSFVADRDPRTLRHVAQADRENPNARRIASHLCRFDWFALLILAIGENHHRFMSVGLREKRMQRSLDCLAQSRATATHILRPDLVERLFEVIVMRRERNLLLRIASEYDEAHAVARHLINRVLDLLLR